MAAVSSVAVSVQTDPAAFRAFLASVKQFDPKLSTNLRTRLRSTGNAIVAKVQATVTEDTPEGTSVDDGTGVREQLAHNTKVSILTGARQSGIRITTSSSGLDASRVAMLKAYNKKTWRHPAQGVLVVEQGRPYFGNVIYSDAALMGAAIRAALDDTLAAMQNTT